MNLLQILATGVTGAENGTAEVYRRGTSTFATLYANYDGSGAVTPTGAVALDANGRAEWFVNEEVDVIVRDSTATPVLSTNPMDTSSNVEVRSQSFTGTEYDTALSGAGSPVALATILDLWKTNAGAIDWKVAINGVATTLQTAFASVSGVFYNVKATAYGAKGDNSSDDTSAIAAAVSAASAAGGGIVFFPAGTYRTTSVLTIPATVQLLGAGCGAATVTVDHATADALQFTTAASDPVTVRGLRIRASQANTGAHIKSDSGAAVILTDCAIGGTNTNGKCVSVDNNSSKLTVVGCLFTMAGGTSYGIYSDGTTPHVRIIGNRFVAPSALNGDVLHLNGGKSVVAGNIFDCSGTSSGTGRVILVSGGYTVAGNRFESPSGGTIQPIVVSGVTGGNFVGLNSRAQSAFWSVAAAAQVSASNATHETSEEYDRNGRRYAVTDNTSPISVDPTIYGVAEVRRTNNANQTINGATPSGPGQFFTLVFNNDQAAGSGTITLGTGFKGQAPFTVIANNVRALVFRSYENMAAGGASATAYWGFVGSTGDVTP